MAFDSIISTLLACSPSLLDLCLAWPPDAIFHGAGKNFMEEPFASDADLLRVRKKAVPVKSVISMNIVERYHQTIRRAYHILKSESVNIENTSALQMAVKVINNSAGPYKLVPTLLVYDALPRFGLPHHKPGLSTFQGSAALQKAHKKCQSVFQNVKYNLH